MGLTVQDLCYSLFNVLAKFNKLRLTSNIYVKILSYEVVTAVYLKKIVNLNHQNHSFGKNLLA